MLIAYLYKGIPPCADLKKKTMETSLHGADIGHGSDTLFPSTAITFSICAVMMMKKKRKEMKE